METNSTTGWSFDDNQIRFIHRFRAIGFIISLTIFAIGSVLNSLIIVVLSKFSARQFAFTKLLIIAIVMNNLYLSVYFLEGLLVFYNFWNIGLLPVVCKCILYLKNILKFMCISNMVSIITSSCIIIIDMKCERTFTACYRFFTKFGCFVLSPISIVLLLPYGVFSTYLDTVGLCFLLHWTEIMIYIDITVLIIIPYVFIAIFIGVVCLNKDLIFSERKGILWMNKLTLIMSIMYIVFSMPNLGYCAYFLKRTEVIGLNMTMITEFSTVATMMMTHWFNLQFSLTPLSFLLVSRFRHELCSIVVHFKIIKLPRDSVILNKIIIP